MFFLNYVKHFQVTLLKLVDNAAPGKYLACLDVYVRFNKAPFPSVYVLRYVIHNSKSTGEPRNNLPLKSVQGYILYA